MQLQLLPSIYIQYFKGNLTTLKKESLKNMEIFNPKKNKIPEHFQDS